MMYNIKCLKKFVNYLDIPSVEDRLSQLQSSKKINIIYIKEVFDNSTFRYRTYNVIQAMENSDKYHINCFLESEIALVIPLLNKVSMIILQRCKWSFQLESFVNYVRSLGIKVCYDMDDLLYDIKYVPGYIENIGNYDEFNIDIHFAIAGRYHQIACLCDSFLVTTETLKKHVEKDFEKKAFLYYNFLNKEQESISDEIISYKNTVRDDSKFYIGYFSGSNSHVRDLAVIESSLLQLMNKYDNIYLYVVGYMKLSDELEELKDRGRVIVHPFVSYQELEYLIASVDVNVIPLQMNEFNECKSELKYFEASIVNTITVACNNSVYSKIIKDGKNGFLANDYEWYTKLENIYLNYDKMSSIIQNAREYCIEEYSYHNQQKKLEKLFDQMIEM